MSARNTRIRAKSEKGNVLHLSQTQTDSPFLDVASLERLHTFRPDLVDFIIKQTEAEAEHRRAVETKLAKYTFVERLLGAVVAILLCVLGISGAVIAAKLGSEKLAIAIVAGCIGTLAVAYIRRNQH